MNLIKRLLKRKILNKELKKLALNLGDKTNKYLMNLFSPKFEYTSHPYGQLDFESLNNKVVFDLEITPRYLHAQENGQYGERFTIKKTIPYEEAIKNSVLKKYIKGKSLEKYFAVFSVASILAGAFFLANNITGNAILTATPNSSGIIGAGLFVLGVGSWILARNF